MSKPSQRSPERKLQVVLSVLRGEVSVAEAEGSRHIAKTNGTLPGALLVLVLALVGLWTGWTEAIFGWVFGHVGDAIIGSVDHPTR